MESRKAIGKIKSDATSRDNGVGELFQGRVGRRDGSGVFLYGVKWEEDFFCCVFLRGVLSRSDRDTQKNTAAS